MAERSIGSADAKVTVQEYFSLTCTHCAAFQKETFPQVKAELIDTGRIRYVWRDYPLDQLALYAAMVARALPPDRYEPFMTALLSTQDRWAFTPFGQPDGGAGEDGGAGRHVARRPSTPTIRDDALKQFVLAEQDEGEKKFGVNSTPTFIMNGKLTARRGVLRHVPPRRSTRRPPPEPMRARFVRLAIAGFKSFAEPATVEILPGLTGDRRPERLRQEQRDRGAALGHGRGQRAHPARRRDGRRHLRRHHGAAEPQPGRGACSRSRRDASVEAAFRRRSPSSRNCTVARRIERGAGSAYRVNGRETRARDVQTLFADLASGARSSAMVSQGRVSALVAARPEERRQVLEEAAGITGLHARRAEAETRLRAAEANLERAEERRAMLETQLLGVAEAGQAGRALSHAVDHGGRGGGGAAGAAVGAGAGGRAGGGRGARGGAGRR